MKITKLPFQVIGQVPDMGASHRALQGAASGMNQMGQGIAQGLGDIGKIVETIVEQKRKISQATQLGEARVSFENDYLTTKNEWDKTNPDVDTYYQQGSKLYDKVLEKSLKQIDDTKVRDHFKIMMLEHKVTVMDSLGREANQKWRDYNIGGMDRRVEAGEQLISRLNDPVYANAEKESIRGEIRAKAPLLLGADRAGDYERAVMRRIDVAAAKTRMIYDPQGLLRALERNEYPDIHPTDRPTLIQATKDKIKSQENEDVDKQVDLVVRGLTKDFTSEGKTDYESIEKRLNDFGYIDQTYGPNINTKIIAKAREDIRSRRLSYEQAAKDKSDVIFKDTILNFNKMTVKEIKNRIINGLNPHTGYALIKELENPPDVPRNPTAFNSLMKRIYEGVEPTDKMTNDILASNQPRGDKMSLLGLAYRDDDKTTDAAVRDADKYLRGYLITKGMLERVLPPEEEALYNATQGLRQRIKEESATKKRKLTPEEIQKIAKETAPLYRKGLAERIELWRQSNIKEAGMIQKYNKYDTAEKVKAAKDLTDLEKVEILKNKFHYTD